MIYYTSIQTLRQGAKSAWGSPWKNTGWGSNNGTCAFLVRDSNIYVTNAHGKLRKCYTPRDEKEFAEENWATEWKQRYHFDSFHLFEQEEERASLYSFCKGIE
jgi:hypothetical protein